MARPGRGVFPIQGKRELGKDKGEGQSSCKHHVGRPQADIFEASQANLGVSCFSKDKPHSVSKVGGVLRSLVKSRHSGRRAWGRQGLLLSPLHSAKGQEQTPSNYRSFLLKQKYKESRSKDARPQFNSQVDKTRYVGGKTRFKRCLLPRSSPPFGLEILQVLPAQERIPSKGLLFQKNAIRPVTGALGVLKDPVPTLEDPKTSRDPGVRIFGRFFDPSSLQRGGSKGHRSGHKAVARSWVQDKLGQVLGGTSQDCGILRGGNKSGRLDLQSSRRKDSKDPSDLSHLSRSLAYLKEVPGINSRVPHLRCELPKMGEAPVKTSPSLDELQHFSLSKGPLGAGGRILQESFSSLVKRKFSSNPHILRGGRGIEGNYETPRRKAGQESFFPRLCGEIGQRHGNPTQ